MYFTVTYSDVGEMVRPLCVQAPPPLPRRRKQIPVNQIITQTEMKISTELICFMHGYFMVSQCN